MFAVVCYDFFESGFKRLFVQCHKIFVFLIPFFQIMDSVIAFLNSPYLLKLCENYHRRSLKLKRNRGTSTQTNLSTLRDPWNSTRICLKLLEQQKTICFDK